MSPSSPPAPLLSESTGRAHADDSTASSPALAADWWFESQHLRIGSIHGTQVVVLQRTAVPALTTEFHRVFGPAEEAMRKLVRSRHTLLIDARTSPGRNDADFERLFVPYRIRLQAGFSRVAVLVVTAPGRLQVQRYAREDKTETEAFDDYRAALAWLEQRRANSS